jgi:hypothetical protein
MDPFVISLETEEIILPPTSTTSSDNTLEREILTIFGFTLLFEGHKISHGVFYIIAIMVIFCIFVAF